MKTYNSSIKVLVISLLFATNASWAEINSPTWGEARYASGLKNRPIDRSKPSTTIYANEIASINTTSDQALLAKYAIHNNETVRMYAVCEINVWIPLQK